MTDKFVFDKEKRTLTDFRDDSLYFKASAISPLPHQEWPLKTILIPMRMRSQFIVIARKYTQKGVEPENSIVI